MALGKIAGGLPKPGRMNAGLFPRRARAHPHRDVGACNGEDDFTLITAATAQWHDSRMAGAASRRPFAGGSHARSLHADRHGACVARPFPEHRHRGRPVTALAQPPVRYRRGRPCTLARVSFAGELGWEVHAANADIPALYDAVLNAGAKPFGMFALNSPADRKGLPRVEGRSVHRLQPSGGRARPVHPLRQAAGLHRQGRASGRKAARALRNASSR
jgi:dimethylglycine dehydrogenase